MDARCNELAGSAGVLYVAESLICVYGITNVHKSCVGKYHEMPASSFIATKYILKLPSKKFFPIFKKI